MHLTIFRTIILTLLAGWLCQMGLATAYAMTLSEIQKLTARDGSIIDGFGKSISISGNTAIIGAPGYRGGVIFSSAGAAYIFVRDSTGVWQEEQILLANDRAMFDQFGSSVSISGNIAVIGAKFDSLSGAGGGDIGSAYVFVRNANGVWQQQQKLLASDYQSDDRFGRSVLVVGDTILISAARRNNNGLSTGSVYVFIRNSAGRWQENQKLFLPNYLTLGDTFGRSLTMSGDTLIIGDFDGTKEAGSFVRPGSAYVFIRDANGIWKQQQKLLANDGEDNDRFGGSVSISKDTAVIGSFQDQDNGYLSGSAYVFIRDASGVWKQQQKLLANDGKTEDTFGLSTSISGNVILIGAEGTNDKGGFSGSAYVFVRDANAVWQLQQKLLATDGMPSDTFGNFVAMSDKTALIAARRNTVYVFQSTNEPLIIEKLINHRLRTTPESAAQLLAGSRYRANYAVTNNGPDRIYRVQVFEGNRLICNLYALDPGESTDKCASNQNVLIGENRVPATVTALVSGTNQELSGQGEAYYTGRSNVPGQLTVTHYINDENADAQTKSVQVNASTAEVLFRVENTGSIELYRIKAYHDPLSPVDSSWQPLCDIGSLKPRDVRFCKRSITVTEDGLNQSVGRVQAINANINHTGFVNASNTTYFNLDLP